MLRNSFASFFSFSLLSLPYLASPLPVLISGDEKVNCPTLPHF